LAEPAMRSYFLPNNCGKEAITLNLDHPDGQALLRALIVKLPVDVFACNQRTRSYARLGIEPERLLAVKSDLIWLGITGFGPEHDEAAYDPVLQARAGFMDLTGDAGGPPTVFGLPMVDLGAAEHGYSEVVKALYRRATTGEGARIDVSMLRSAVSWMVAPITLAGSLGERVTRKGNRHQFFAPVAVHRTRDGHVYLAVGNDQQWAALTALSGFAGLARPEYAANAGRIADVDRLDRALADCFADLGTAEAPGSRRTPRTTTRPRATRRSRCARSSTPASSASGCRRNTAGRTWAVSRSPWSPRSSDGRAPGRPRTSARTRSAACRSSWPAPRSRRRSTCPVSRPGSSWRRTRSRSPAPARTPRASGPRRSARAIATS